MEINHKHKHHKNKHDKNVHHIRGKKLLYVTVLNLLITMVQIIGGLISNSLSLLSDALHNLADSSAIFIAFLAGKRSRKKPDKYRTFGYQRIEILAALFNAVVLIAICIFLFFEAYQRFIKPEPIKGQLMFIVATFGLLANLVSVLVLNKDKDHNLNIKAAYLHLMGDTLSSIAVILGGIAIWKYNIFWIDPVITVFVGLYIIYHTWGIVQKTVDILMQSTPEEIDVNKIKASVETLNEVDNIHHLHVWKLDDTQIHLEAHVNLKNNMDIIKMMNIKKRIELQLRQKFGIGHITLQMGYGCCLGNEKLIDQIKT